MVILAILFNIINVLLPNKGDDKQDANEIQILENNLKWKMYTLSYNTTLKKMAHQGPGKSYKLYQDSLFNPLACDVAIDSVQSLGDTTLYLMSFKRLNKNDKYRQPEDSYVGIGYVRSKKEYFPIHGTSSFNNDQFRDFFKQQEVSFIKYLQSYKELIVPWLKTEAVKRNVF